MDQNKNEEVVEKLIEALGGLTDAIQPLTDEEKKNAEAAKKSAKRLEEVGAQLGVFAKSMGSAAKAMTSADEGTAKYAAGLEGATGAVASTTTLIDVEAVDSFPETSFTLMVNTCVPSDSAFVGVTE